MFTQKANAQAKKYSKKCHILIAPNVAKSKLYQERGSNKFVSFSL